MNEKYAAPDGRKLVYSSLNPVKLLRGANIFTYVLLLVLALVIAVIVLVTVAASRKKRRRAAEK